MRYIYPCHFTQFANIVRYDSPVDSNMVEVMVFDIKTTVTRHLNYLVFFRRFFCTKESSIDPMGWNRLELEFIYPLA